MNPPVSQTTQHKSKTTFPNSTRRADMSHPSQDLKRKRDENSDVVVIDSDCDDRTDLCAKCASNHSISFDTNPNLFCAWCDECLCETRDPTCLNSTGEKCSVASCRRLVCEDCMAGDGRCTDCAGTSCACCGEFDADEKIVCVDCDTQYCVATCHCECANKRTRDLEAEVRAEELAGDAGRLAQLYSCVSGV